MRYPASLRYAFHPHLPVKLGYRKLLGVTHPELSRLLRATDDYTLMSARNRTTLYREGLEILRRGVPGHFMELGVHYGGSSAVLAYILKDELGRKLHLFDRWGDLPEPTEQDGYRKDQYARDNIPEKLAMLRNDPPLYATRRVVEEVIGFPRDRVVYHQGWYDDTLQQYAEGPIAFASIDCDYYESVKQSLVFVAEHASPGTTMIFDDYRAWPGTKTAVHEWLASTRFKTQLQVLGIGPAILRILE